MDRPDRESCLYCLFVKIRDAFPGDCEADNAFRVGGEHERVAVLGGGFAVCFIVGFEFYLGDLVAVGPKGGDRLRAVGAAVDHDHVGEFCVGDVEFVFDRFFVGPRGAAGDGDNGAVGDVGEGVVAFDGFEKLAAVDDCRDVLVLADVGALAGRPLLGRVFLVGLCRGVAK